MDTIQSTPTWPVYPPPCKCEVCQRSFRGLMRQKDFMWSYSGEISDNDARVLQDRYVEEINSGREVLQTTLNRFGDHIAYRWRKKTRAERATFLSELEPDLVADKDALVEMAYQNLEEGLRCRWQRRFFRLLPYLDVRTLAKNPATLLGLIQARTLHSPAQWASYDYEQLTFSWACAYLDVHFNGGAVVLHGPEYGTYASWEEGAAHRYEIAGYPRSRLLLEAQATLICFLQRVVAKLSYGLEIPDASAAEKWSNSISSARTSIEQSSPWSSFVCRPFLEPVEFNVDKLMEAAKSRVSATTDHLWLLQTEPAYFKRYMRQKLQTDIGQKDTKGRPSLIQSEISADVDENRFWRMIVVELEYLAKVICEHRASIGPGSDLPRVVAQTFGGLELLLIGRATVCSREIGLLMRRRPTFSHHYEVLYADPLTPKTLMTGALRFYGVKDARYMEEGGGRGSLLKFRTERMWWIFDQIATNPHAANRFPFIWLLDMLNDHLEPGSPKNSVKLDEVLYQRLANLITVLELLQALQMHCPRTIYDKDDIMKTGDRVTWHLGRRVGGEMTKLIEVEMEQLLLTSFRETPMPSGPRNMQWLEQYNTLHRALMAYWGAVAMSSENGYKRIGLPQEHTEFLLQPLMCWSHPDYTSRLEPKRQQIRDDIRKAKISKSDNLFLPLPSTDDGSASVITKNPRVRPKTRGETLGLEQLQVQDPDEIEAPQTQIPTIAVSKRSHFTFRCMFPEAIEERQKNISWDVFVNSMIDAGLVVSNAGGSLVNFEDESGKKIILHRPHPDPTIDPIMLQSMGRRMNKHFDWTRETFVVGKKTS